MCTMVNQKTRTNDPVIVVTMGDANGVGPEILLKAYQSGELRHRFFAVGDKAAIMKAKQMLPQLSSVAAYSMRELDDIQPDALNLFDLGLLADGDVSPGAVSEKAGDASKQYVHKAAEAILNGRAHALVTLPVCKEAVQISTPGFTGHTEYIAEICEQEKYTMMLASEKLTVTHVSTHVSMREAIEAVAKERVLDVIRLTRDALIQSLSREPRIAVAGMNAHAGEHGLFGREELDEIMPAIASARSLGFDASGPYPPDTVFLRAAGGEFDAVVCMYHDQGHIPLKLLDFSGGVNVTLGLKIIRTSVDHGTAFDIAYKGAASTESFVRAFNMAADMIG